MRRKHLEGMLESLEGFSKPNIKLEQYTTGVSLTIDVMNQIMEDGFLEHCFVVDFGCGTGMLTAAASVMGARHVLGVDIDEAALAVCQDNMLSIECENFHLLQCDVASCSLERFDSVVDTIIMNPPFGTKNNQGIDVQFVNKALALNPKVVYSMHKSSTRKHMLQIGGEYGAKAEVIAELKFDLPSTYRFHKKQSQDIHVDLIRFTMNT